MREKSNLRSKIRPIDAFKMGAQKYSDFNFPEMCNELLHPVSLQRDVSRSSRHVRRGCSGRGCARLTSGTDADGEVVWSWRPEAWR
jgi:hypothetical protein